jgi:hypothetical protein
MLMRPFIVGHLGGLYTSLQLSSTSPADDTRNSKPRASRRCNDWKFTSTLIKPLSEESRSSKGSSRLSICIRPTDDVRPLN